MANNVIGQVAGGTKTVFDSVSTVNEVAAKLGVTAGYTPAINGDTVEMQDALQSGDMVTFSKSVKGGL